MKSSGGILLPAYVVVALGVAAAWHYASRIAPAQIAVAVDQSQSVEPNCAGLAQAGMGSTQSESVRDGSTLTVLVMGTQPADPEPKLVFTLPVPIAPDVVYGGSEKVKTFREEQEALRLRIQQACESAALARHSPIYQLVVQGIAHLRGGGFGCAAGGHCYFLVKTDLDEDVHPGLRALLERAATDSAVEVTPELAGSIDNAGIEIVFCGAAEVKPRRASRAIASAERRERIWRALFTQPGLVSFKPFCSP